MFVYFWEREDRVQAGEGPKGRHRIWSRFQALSCQHRPWCGARTHEQQDHDLSQNWMLNQLSHPGTPKCLFLIIRTKDINTCEETEMINKQTKVSYSSCILSHSWPWRRWRAGMKSPCCHPTFLVHAEYRPYLSLPLEFPSLQDTHVDIQLFSISPVF